MGSGFLAAQFPNNTKEGVVTRLPASLASRTDNTFFHVSTTLAAYAKMWMYLCLWSWLILAPGLKSDCMNRSRKAGTRI